MASRAPAPEPDAAAEGARARPATWSDHFSRRMDGVTSAIFVMPLFLVYQAGILTQRGANGVDFVTRGLVELCQRDLDNYLIVLGALSCAYAAVVAILWQRGRFDPRAFGPMLAESAAYALSMGTLILFVMSQLAPLAPKLALAGGHGFLDIVVISAGAGLHEELVFRLVGLGGLSWLLAGLMGENAAFWVAFVLTALAFSLAHHIGPGGEPFTTAAFTYRLLAGAFFATVYQLRGFGVAAWTHALYDVYVLSLT